MWFWFCFLKEEEHGRQELTSWHQVDSQLQVEEWCHLHRSSRRHLKPQQRKQQLRGQAVGSAGHLCQAHRAHTGLAPAQLGRLRPPTPAQCEDVLGSAHSSLQVQTQGTSCDCDARKDAPLGRKLLKNCYLLNVLLPESQGKADVNLLF